MQVKAISQEQILSKFKELTGHLSYREIGDLVGPGHISYVTMRRYLMGEQNDMKLSHYNAILSAYSKLVDAKLLAEVRGDQIEAQDFTEFSAIHLAEATQETFALCQKAYQCGANQA